MKGVVKNNDRFAGLIERVDGEHIFTYDEGYFNDPNTFSISLSIPKTERVHKSRKLHPFFQGMLTEGSNKKIQCQILGLDADDDFLRLVKTAANTIGAITVTPS